jgi:hypothetical protein
MTGFDLGSIGGFDIGRFQKEVMRAMSERGPNMIDPPKVGENVPLRPSTTSETVEGKGFDLAVGVIGREGTNRDAAATSACDRPSSLPFYSATRPFVKSRTLRRARRSWSRGATPQRRRLS